MAQTVANDIPVLQAVAQMLGKYAATSQDEEQGALLLAAMAALEKRLVSARRQLVGTPARRYLVDVTL